MITSRFKGLLYFIVSIFIILLIFTIRKDFLTKARETFQIIAENPLKMPTVGSYGLRILSPSMLELTLITTKLPDTKVAQWDFVGPDSKANLPQIQALRVSVNGHESALNKVGFKRRVLYAPLAQRDLRIGNYLYLELVNPIPEGASVEVKNPDNTLWKSEVTFTAKASDLRESPVIHVNQVGYIPSLPKKAIVGYYLGNLGELPISENQEFKLIEVTNEISISDSKVVFTGRLVQRKDQGYSYAVPPYQQVFEADFSNFKIPGRYRLMVPGLGVSFPFLIDESVSVAFARAYALGLYHQRCGIENTLPFTRFVHAACHITPADVPTMAFKRVQEHLKQMSNGYEKNPRHSAPQLKDVDSSLYPFVRSGKVDVSGGHHDAGDYSKYAINSAHLIHHLVFAVDVFPGVEDLDNLGLPESGDGKSDLLQISKWEADFLAKMQDDDGGFYFLVYPKDRPYENTVLPDHGDLQVVFPKNTAATAAAVAALVHIASSHRFQKEFPAEAGLYLEKAKKGWEFLEHVWAKYGRDGSYQKISHYGDTFMDDDEIAWAATEMFLATGNPNIHARLLSTFDPTDSKTRRWGWWRLFESYGNAIRSYAFAERTGRATKVGTQDRASLPQLDKSHLEKCIQEILAGGQDQMRYTQDSAYGTSFPFESKKFRTAGWYFSTSSAFDLVVAYQRDPRPELLESIISNINYEGGANPNNVTFLTGLGWKRQREIVHQYAQNDRRVLPPSGIPFGNVQSGFAYLAPYKKEPDELSFPPDGDKDNPFPFYERWGDSFNTATEFTVVTQARSLASLAFLMAQTPLKNQPWTYAQAKIVGIPQRIALQTGVTARLELINVSNTTDFDLSKAQIVWEAQDQEPTFGSSYNFIPLKSGPQWIEAEAQWPDGRRAFATLEFQVFP
jgi:hypothetical protein